MPRNYQRTSQRACWSGATLDQALEAVRNGTPKRGAARTFGIPRATLQRRLKLDKPLPMRLGRPPVFAPEAERELAERVVLLSKCFLGITRTEIRKCAYEYAHQNNIKHPFTEETKSAGFDWLYGFLRRNPSISLRQPEATSMNRATAFNREEVELFFHNLESLLEKYNFSVTEIYNADETGITTVQRPSKVLAQKGAKQVGFITSAERGKTVTAVCSFSAAGHYVPVMLIYPRKRMNPQLQRQGPGGAIYECSDNGWITEELFVTYLKHFAKTVKPSPDNPVLLIIDNHSTHCTLEVYEFCKNNGIVLLMTPPHTSHRLQPLDVTFFGPLKAAYNNECNKFLKSHPHQKITLFEIAELFNRANMRVSTPEKGVKGFEKTGIWPFNPDVFTEADFLPAELRTEQTVEEETPRETTPTDPINVASEDEQHVNEIPQNPVQVAGCSRDRSFGELLPLPEAKTTTRKTSRKRQHSEIITSTPTKDNLVEKANRKQKKVAIIANKAVARVKKVVFAKEDDKEDSQCTQTHAANSDDSDEDIVGEDLCLVCGEFGKNGEMWLKCVQCGNWAHRACADVSRKQAFICDFCR